MDNLPLPSLECGRRWTFGDCTFEELSRRLTIRDELIKLESKPLDVLQHMLEHPTQVLTKDELIGAVWTTATSDQSLATAISKLRRAFGGARDSVIVNVSGMGYRMAVTVVCTVSPELVPPSVTLKPGDPMPGRKHWLAVRKLGLGDAQTVWLAEHQKTREAHVFKFAVDGLRLRALQREVSLSRIFQQTFRNDQRFVRILDWNFDQTPFCIESEYSGVNLFDFAEIVSFRAMPLAERVALAIEICGAVTAAHGLGILHNDLKPSNILLAPQAGAHIRPQNIGAAEDGALAGSWQIKIADFGIASLTNPGRLAEMDITNHGEFEPRNDISPASNRLGTAMYRSPESFLPGALPSMRTDTYALGVILYQIVTGDFLETPSPGWEARIDDPLLREDIAAAANVNPDLRLSSAAELTDRLQTLPARRLERQHRQQELAATERAMEAIVRARLRRPWIALAMAALLLGVGISLWFARRAAIERDLAVSRAESLTAMNDFLTVDVLGQSNPLAAPAHSGSVASETLLEAINRALPQIDRRFARNPEIAAQLHQTLAVTLDARTHYGEARQQFSAAAQQFRQAEGPLSINAIVAELRGDNAQMRGMAAPAIAAAHARFDVQEKLIAQLPAKPIDLIYWEAFVQSGLQMMSPTPAAALPSLEAALRRTQATRGFSPSLFSSLQQRLCNLYLSLDRGKDAEQLSRQLLLAAGIAHGADSAATFQPRMSLMEALLIQGNYISALAESSSSTPLFTRVLGADNQLTLSAFFIRAQAEAALADYPGALRDQRLVYNTARALPSGRFMAENSLSALASLECQAGNTKAGAQHARQLMAGDGTGATAQPLFVQSGSFLLAECLLIGQETAPGGPNPAILRQIDHLLATVDATTFTEYPGYADFPGKLALAQARLDLLRGNREAARPLTQKAAIDFNPAAADPYYRKQFARVRTALTN